MRNSHVTLLTAKDYKTKSHINTHTQILTLILITGDESSNVSQDSDLSVMFNKHVLIIINSNDGRDGSIFVFS